MTSLQQTNICRTGTRAMSTKYKSLLLCLHFACDRISVSLLERGKAEPVSKVPISMQSTSRMSTESKKSVRFAAASTVSIVDSNTNVVPSGQQQLEGRPVKKRKLEKTDHRMNDDELDDVDEWNPDEDNDGDDDDDGDNTGSIDAKYKSDRDLREAKSQRRIKRVIGDNDDEVDTTTRIDNRTSLAAEGYKVEPFNMDQERNDGSGYFDGDTYVFRKRNDEDDEPDAWVDSLNDESTKSNDDEKQSEAAIRHDRIAMQRAELRRKQAVDEIDNRMDNWSEQDLYSKLLPHLEGNETIMGALVRYGQHFQMKNRNKSSTKVDAGVAATPKDAERRQIAQDSFNILTEAANALLLKGKIDIYDTKRSDIEAIIQSTTQLEATHAAVTSDIVLSSNDDGKNAIVQWEYQGNQDGKIHGPFSTKEMLGWVNAGYFVGSMAVQVRTIMQPPPKSLRDKSIKEDLLKDLFNDDDDDDNGDTHTNGNTSDQTPNLQRGEWILSDKVDFHKYIK